MPESYDQFKVHDQINAFSTFLGDGALDVEFVGLGDARRSVLKFRMSNSFGWLSAARQKTISALRSVSGFVGCCTYELPSEESEICNFELLKWLALGELVHVGKHTAWGNGWYQVRGNTE